MDNFGVWCAIRGALLLVVRLEKMKMREKYERHYLVLGLATNAILWSLFLLKMLGGQVNDP